MRIGINYTAWRRMLCSRFGAVREFLFGAIVCLILTCTSPGQEMKANHPEFWSDIIGEWEILEGNAGQSSRLRFSEDLKVSDTTNLICGGNATPNYWTGKTPESSKFSGTKDNSTGSKGSIGLMKMQYKRGQFMVVCNGEKMNYVDHIIYYDLGSEAAGYKGKRRSTDGVNFLVIQDEGAGRRTFAYRR